jgi:hypothetical protein
VANTDSTALRNYLAKMERGGIFADFGIKNFLEGDFFGWYLDIWDGSIDAALRRLIGDLANYSLVTLDVDSEETRDLLSSDPAFKAAILANPPVYDTQYWAEWSQPWESAAHRSSAQGVGLT